MKVLFVCRGKAGNSISPVVKAQMDSLKSHASILLFPIQGKGVIAYVKSIPQLIRFIRTNKPDLIHAHYAHSGFVAALSSRKPVICSLMGSDIEDFRISRIIIRFFARVCWKAVIVKSERSKKKIRIKKSRVTPNGVDLNMFQAVDSNLARRELGFDMDKKYILFVADPARKEKNFGLASESCKLLAEGSELLAVYDKPHKEIPLFLSAADLVLMTSCFEGSPNVIKEAMACGCPIVSTDVGDVREICGDTEGTFICSWDPREISRAIENALLFGKRTTGRERIKHLDSNIVAKKIITVYNSVLDNN